jgi:RNA polymerase sigma-70 factor (ECF subfamily)
MTEADRRSEPALVADLLAVAERRDREAFGRLFAFYAPRVKGYLRRRGTEEAMAEDLTQEVMLTMWRRAHQFDEHRATPSTWVFTIARNKRIDALRRGSRPELEAGATDLPEEVDPAPRGERVVEARQMEEMVSRAIQRLPKEQAELVRIFYFEDKPHTVIADELGLPFGTVKSRLRLALSKLRVMLGGEAP